MKAPIKTIDLKRELPLFDDAAESEIDEILVSVAWDLCGYRESSKRQRRTALY